MIGFGIPIKLHSERKVKIHGKELFSSILSMLSMIQSDINASVSGVPINLFSIASSISTLSESIKLEDSLESQLANLISKSYQKSILDVLKEYEKDLDIPQKDWEVSGIYDEIENLLCELEQKSYEINDNFFKYFNESVLVNDITNAFINYLEVFCSIPETSNIKASFKYSFLTNITYEFCNNLERYKLLQIYDSSPFKNSIKAVSLWTKYRLILIDQMYSKVPFDPSFCLDDIYIQLYGSYATVNELGRTIHETIVKTEDWLINWINDSNIKNNIMLVSGKPASGKTTLLKKISSILASDYQKVLFIPIKHFPFDEKMYHSIADYCIQRLDFNPFEGLAPEEKLTILFDGLDEVALKGDKSLEKARQFIDFINRDFSDRKNIKIIISGRSLVVKENSEIFINNGIKYVLDILPLYLNEKRYELYRGYESTVDQRPLWWEKYGKIKNKPYCQIPDAIVNNLQCKDSSFDEITSEPFLLYLLAESYEGEKLDFTKPVSVNKLYHDFTIKIYQNYWSNEKRSGIATEIKINDFILFLKQVGLCSWLSGNQQIPLIILEKRCREKGILDMLEDICSNTNVFENITGLMLLFYIDRKALDTNDEKVFEFSHKSFGEYFAAIEITDIIIDLFSNKNRIDDTALLKLLDILGHQLLDEYVTSFVLGQFSILYESNPELIDRIQENLSIYFPQLISKEISLNILLPYYPNDKVMFQSIRNLEKAIYVLFTHIGHITTKYMTPPYLAQQQFTEWINKDVEFWGIIPELESKLDISKTISWINMNKCYCSGIYLTNYEIKNCVFPATSFESGSFIHAALINCSFKGSNFTNANFSYANLDHIVFDSCDFSSAVFYITAFFNVKFINCRFNCTFNTSRFENVEFEGNCKNALSINSSFNNVNYVGHGDDKYFEKKKGICYLGTETL